ncbi:MAG: hypothetical protein RL217_1046, partial [Pseudomonadota bacterium]
KALAVLDEFTSHFYQPLGSFLQQDIRSSEGQEKLIAFMSEKVTEYMQNQVQGQHDMLIIEQSFRYEALINPKVRELAQMHRKALYEKAIEFFSVQVKSANPRADAEILIGLFHTMEYNSLLSSPEPADMAHIRNIIEHYIRLLVTFLLK